MTSSIGSVGSERLDRPSTQASRQPLLRHGACSLGCAPSLNTPQWIVRFIEGSASDPVTPTFTNELRDRCRSDFATILPATFGRLQRASQKTSLNAVHVRNAAVLSSLHEAFAKNGICIDPARGAADIGALCQAVQGDGVSLDGELIKLDFSTATDAFRILYHGMNDTPVLKDIAPQHRARLCIDPIRLADADAMLPEDHASGNNPLLFLLFEDEPGYLLGMARAWSEGMSRLDEPVTSRTILELHALAKGLPSDAKLSFQTRTHGFDLIPGETLSTSGRDELFAFFQESRELRRALGVGVVFLTDDSAFDHLRLAIDFDEHANEDFARIIDHRLATYYATVGQVSDGALSSTQRAYAAIDVCQKLERLHPLQDGNCRITCTILPAILLAQQRQQISVIDNPNKLDGFSRAEILGLLCEGQIRVDGWCSAAASTDSARSTRPNPALSEQVEAWLYPTPEASTDPYPGDDFSDLSDLE